MIEKTGVIGDLASVTKIVRYEKDNGFRVFGELKNMDSAKRVKDKFDGFLGGRYYANTQGRFTSPTYVMNVAYQNAG
ncbi:MAG: hypothetical protein ACREBG_22275 [Pyrinomonadaceae bacterium]